MGSSTKLQSAFRLKKVVKFSLENKRGGRRQLSVLFLREGWNVIKKCKPCVCAAREKRGRVLDTENAGGENIKVNKKGKEDHLFRICSQEERLEKESSVENNYLGKIFPKSVFRNTDVAGGGAD